MLTYWRNALFANEVNKRATSLKKSALFWSQVILVSGELTKL